MPVLTRLHVSYRLTSPEGTGATVERVLRRHASRCPTTMTLKGAVEVTWEAEVTEGGENWRLSGSRDD